MDSGPIRIVLQIFHSLVVKKSKPENTVEILAGAAIKVLNYFKQSSSQEGNTHHPASTKSGDTTGISLAKKVQIRSQYLQQLCEVQKLCDEEH